MLLLRQNISESDKRRFFAKVTIPEDPTACWGWTASTNAKGYGKLSFGGGGSGWREAHRFSWTLHIGDIPDALCVLHHCDNPPCANPAHLFLGDRVANNADMAAKGRRAHAPRAVLNESEVLAIAERIRSGDRNCDIAKGFGITGSQVSNIRQGKAWADITGFTHTGRKPWSCKAGHDRSRWRQYGQQWTCLDCTRDYQRQWRASRATGTVAPG